jgi:hypothetical protein
VLVAEGEAKACLWLKGTLCPGRLLQQATPGSVTVVAFLTHFGDLSSWEYAQKLTNKVIPRLQERGVTLVAVGLGSPENARLFSETLNFPLDLLYAGLVPHSQTDAVLRPQSSSPQAGCRTSSPRVSGHPGTSSRSTRTRRVVECPSRLPCFPHRAEGHSRNPQRAFSVVTALRSLLPARSGRRLLRGAGLQPRVWGGQRQRQPLPEAPADAVGHRLPGNDPGGARARAGETRTPAAAGVHCS